MCNCVESLQGIGLEEHWAEPTGVAGMHCMVMNDAHIYRNFPSNEKWGQTPFSHVLRLAGVHVAGKACHEDFDELEITTLPF